MELKLGGKIALLLVIGALALGALYKFGVIKPGHMPVVGKTIDKDTLDKIKAGTETPTTAKTYSFVAKQALGEVKGVSNYQFKDNTIVFPINIWGGWAPIVAANNGFGPNKDSVFFKKHGILVDLKLIDDPSAARDAFASGQSHVLWGTLDMIALFAPGLSRDSRTVPIVFQQIDWSNGGDGIVVRSRINEAKDLRGKTIVLAQHSPSHYYILSVLTDAGIQPSEVNFKFTSTAFEAAKAFVDNADIDACVSWSPDIYNIIDEKYGGKKGGVAGARLLTTTRDASQLITDVYAVRADFARDHHDLVKGLVAGIYDGYDIVQKEPGKVAGLMAKGFGVSAEEAKSMMGDAHLTNYAENKKFFLDKDNPANFARTWAAASYVYKSYGAIGTPVRADEVADSTVLAELDGKYPHHKDEYTPAFNKINISHMKLESQPILTKSVMITFAPNSWNLDSKYDSNISNVIEEVGQLAGKFAAARVVIEGNVDTSRKIEFQREGPRVFQEMSLAVQELSERRAESVKTALAAKYKFPQNKLAVIGNGWDNPMSLTDHTKNRRVEIKVYPPEAE
ncbi:MAG: ABC transporter substrate-binding protein [Elusimicrobia bacterium]|nr:ABC transporter substrate-binding protein [Elusimicrobiota bacterium]